MAVTETLSLAEFLQRPETQPASEYVGGKIVQKPMPKGKHSRLQGKLCAEINRVAETSEMAYAFPELRCTFGDRSIVPDLAVFRWNRIPLDEAGEFANDFFVPPDWAIEILSPNQTPNYVIGNILHCLQYGTALGWFVDPGDRSILVFRRGEQPERVSGGDRVAVLSDIDLELTVEGIFGWLKRG